MLNLELEKMASCLDCSLITQAKERNLIAARFGNVSLLASDDYRIRQGNEGLAPISFIRHAITHRFFGVASFLPIGRQREICGQPL